MKKIFITFLLLGLLLPTITEAGGKYKRKKPRCKDNGSVVVCGMPKPRKPRKCTQKKPCIPKGYYRPSPPRVIPMS